jgi:hypothetical protein
MFGLVEPSTAESAENAEKKVVDLYGAKSPQAAAGKSFLRRRESRP